MPLITMPVELSSVVEALDRIGDRLSVIADALTRLSPAVVDATGSTPIRPAGLRDLERTNSPNVIRVRQELDTFAEEHNVVVNSEAFMASIAEYERQVAEVYGPEAIAELPWNKIGTPIFESTAHQPQAGKGQADRESTARTAPQAESGQPDAGPSGHR